MATKNHGTIAASAIWQRVLALDTFDSVRGRRVQVEARRRLRHLSPGVDRVAAERIFRFYLREAADDLWRNVATLYNEHASLLVDVLGDDRSLHARLLRAANEAGGSTAVRAMGVLFAFAASQRTERALLERARAKRATFDHATTLIAIQRVLPDVDDDTAAAAPLLHAAARWLITAPG